MELSVRAGDRPGSTQRTDPGAPAAQHRCSPVPRGSSTQWATTGAPEAPCEKEWWARKGRNPDKTGMGKTKDNGVATVQRKSPGTPRSRTHHSRQPYRSVSHPRSTRHLRPSRSVPCTHAAHGVVERRVGRPVQCVEEWGTWASRTHKRGETGGGQPQSGGAWAAKAVKRPPQQPAQLRCANYWAPLPHNRHPQQPAQPRYTSDWAARTWKRHQQEHRPQRPSERSNPTQHAKGRTGDCPGPRKETATRRNVTQGGFWYSLGRGLG